MSVSVPAVKSQNKPVVRRERGRGVTARVVTFEASCRQGLTATSAFQHPDWIDTINRHLVPAFGGTLMCVEIACSQTGARLAWFALTVAREGRLRVARFADCGVSDYNAPWFAEGATERLDAHELMRALHSALPGVDLIGFDRMPANPLCRHSGARPARTHGHSLTLRGSVDAYIASRGKKYRKEVERCLRLAQARGGYTFKRAETPSEIDAAYAALEKRQAARQSDATGGYALAAPHFSAFYREVLGHPSGLGHIFTVSIGGDVIAVLLGICDGRTFTLLRIASCTDSFRAISPGRLIVLDAMRWFVERGVTTFDFGMGDYAFKASFGAEPMPLTDLVVPLTVWAVPAALHARLKADARTIIRSWRQR